MFRQSMTWLHTWSGIVVTWLLYFMFVTGTIGYFDDELDLWMTPERTASPPLALADAVPVAESYLHEVGDGANRWFIYPTIQRSSPQLSTFREMPAVDGGDPVRKRKELDVKTGEPITDARKTGGGQVLYRMHYLLHYFPGRIGFYIMAIVTMFMFVGLTTGVVAHKKIFKDFFTFRWAKGRRSWLDLHNIASVSSLPFQLMITYSGLLFTLGLLWMPFVALGGYGFDIQRIVKLPAEFTAEDSVERSGESRALVPLLPLAEQAEAAWGPQQIAFIRVDYPGDANARVIVQQRSTGRFSSDAMTFDGVSGALLGTTATGVPNAALEFAGLMFALHEGGFAEPLLRWIYFISGLIGTAMIATGAVYWVEKRRPKDPSDPGSRGYRFVERANVATLAGLLTAVAVYLLANRLLPVGLADRAAWEVHCMFLAWLATFVHAFTRPVVRAWVEQFWIVAAAFFAVPVVNVLTTDVHLLNTLRDGNWTLASVDLVLLSTGIAAVFAARAMMPAKERGDSDAVAPALAAHPGASGG
ncbi:MAG: PepSY-associated TM helix domain-containing protein [Pseudomonadota bacterium]